MYFVQKKRCFSLAHAQSFILLHCLGLLGGRDWTSMANLIKTAKMKWLICWFSVSQLTTNDDKIYFRFDKSKGQVDEWWNRTLPLYESTCEPSKTIHRQTAVHSRCTGMVSVLYEGTDVAVDIRWARTTCHTGYTPTVSLCCGWPRDAQVPPSRWTFYHTCCTGTTSGRYGWVCVASDGRSDWNVDNL